VKRGTEAPQDQFAALSESIHDGRINLLEAGKLADAGRVRFSTILQAQEAERKVEAAVKAGKVLPKNRAHALKLALSDAAAFAALVEQARPVVDLRSHGHAGGGEQPTAQQALMAEVNAYAKENKCSVSVALSEVTKRKPDLWRDYSEEIVAATEAAEEED
jgi:phage I-like protein